MRQPPFLGARVAGPARGLMTVHRCAAGCAGLVWFEVGVSVPSAIIDHMDDMDDQDSEGRHDPPTIEELATQLDDLKAELAKAKRSVVWEAVACSSVIATVLALIVGAVWALWRDQGPTTADDNLDQLLRPGPHCYNSSAEMAAARQRALTAVDRIRWEREFTQRWDSEHRQPVEEPVSMIPRTSASSRHRHRCR